MAANTSEKSELRQKVCKHCKKKVNSSLDCVFCESYFYPSAHPAKVANNENKVNCCKQRGKSEVNKNEKISENKRKEIFRNYWDKSKYWALKESPY